MTKTHQEVIDEHIAAMEKEHGIEIIKFHADYSPACDPEDLANEFQKLRSTGTVHSKIDALTLAEAKIARYEKILDEVSDMGVCHIKDWLVMSESERNLRHKLFSLTEMADTINMSDDIAFVASKGVL